VDPKRPDQLFEQLAETCRDRIEAGKLRPRQRLLTQEKIADAENVQKTVLWATRHLAVERWIRAGKQPGRGLPDR
jgi:DNA-binding transcriptional MocR family regulator